MSYEESHKTLSVFPQGLAHFEFVELLETESDRQCASARLSQMLKEGLAVKNGQRLNPATGHLGTVYAPTGKTFAARTQEDRNPSRKRRGPFDQEVKNLREWKRAAIARFPELGVDPALVRARKQVAAFFAAEGQMDRVALVESGEMDDCQTMRVVLALIKKEPTA